MNGLPQSAHPMLTAGRRAFYGLPSPSLDVIQRGDPVTVAYGVHGALNARAGFLVEDASELPDEIGDYVEKLVAPYFSAAVDWYETIGIGVPGGALWSAVHDRIGDPFFGVSLNPGHLIHIDEWLHSPVFSGSEIPLALGHGPAGRHHSGDRHAVLHLQYRGRHRACRRGAARGDRRCAIPEAWARIEARRAFMTETLGIRLKPEVLPFSNIPAFLPPFWLARDQAMTVESHQSNRPRPSAIPAWTATA